MISLLYVSEMKQAMRNKTFRHWFGMTLSAILPLGGCFLWVPSTSAQIPSQLKQPANESRPLDSEASQFPPQYQETPYTLGAGDTVNINIFNVPEYTGDYRVSVDGTLNLPIVGTVDVKGLTIPEAQELIANRYTPILQRPIVTVTLAQRRPIRVAISGEVNRPGSYTLSSGAGRGEGQGNQQFPTITQAIQQAGGITRSANVREVKLRREIQGQPSVLTVNLWKLVEEGQIVQDVTLRDGDRIIIPTASENNPRETRQLSQSTIAPETQAVEVAVVGEVNRPGSYDVEAGASGTPPTVTEAIQAAGGITNFSNIRDIKVERTTSKGTQKVLTANLWQLLKEGKVTENVLLQSGDKVIVPRAQKVNPTEAEALASASFSPETIRVNVIGEAERTGTLELPANTPLNQAILAAGGFNNRADKGEVELVRLNANGTVTRREIEVNLNKGIDQQSNPILRNNDVIVVERSTLASVSDTVGTILDPVSQIFQGFRFFEIFFGND